MVLATVCISLVDDCLDWSRLACCVVGIYTLHSSVFTVASRVLGISSSFACVMVSQVSVLIASVHIRLVFRLLKGYVCYVDSCSMMLWFVILFILVL